MTDSVLNAVIGACGVLIGGIIGAISSYLTTSTGRLMKRRTDELLRAYEDIGAFHRLEARYIKHLASTEKNAESWKRRVRREQSEAGESTPGESATDLQTRRRIAELRR
jgi:hypothetical protein